MLRRGFTLVEMMAVVVILALAAAVVAVNADYITASAALRSEARRIASRFLLARLYAVSNAKTYTLVYEFNEDEALVWTLMPQKEDEEGHIVDEEREIVGGVADKLHPSVQMLAIALPDGTTYEEGHVEVDVSPYCDAGSHIVVLAQRDNPDKKIWIKMNALTGIVTYHDEEVSFWPRRQEEEEQQGGTQ
ncbi:MAG: hypothetical protein DRP82_05085 [Planctomycetota bacterium]|nr:MAG: hypothetical protein DRP82_05085 [Planctomycetota bacterium]